MKKKTGDHSY